MGSDSSGLGDYQGTNYIIFAERKSNAAIAKGDVCDTNSSGDWREAPTSGAVAPFGVAIKSRLAADTDVPILTEGIVIVRADGAIKRQKYVMPSATTAGEVIEYVASAAGATPSQSDVNTAGAAWSKVVGRYIGHPGEVGPGADLATDAVDGDLIIIQLGSR